MCNSVAHSLTLRAHTSSFIGSYILEHISYLATDPHYCVILSSGFCEVCGNVTAFRSLLVGGVPLFLSHDVLRTRGACMLLLWPRCLCERKQELQRRRGEHTLKASLVFSLHNVQNGPSYLCEH